MNAWDTTIYGNDAARDWIAELYESVGWDLIDEVFAAVLEFWDDPLDSSVGEEALAAVDVVAWANGQPGRQDDATDGLMEWIEEHEMEVDHEHMQLAHRVLERVLSEPSELRDHWVEAGEYDVWVKSVNELRSRLD